MKDFQKYLDQELCNVVFDEEIDDDNTFSIEKILALQITQARREQKLSQLELSRITRIQQSSLSKIENGTGNPSVQTLQRIAIGLHKKLIITLE